jgi:hypothetical protein
MLAAEDSNNGDTEDDMEEAGEGKAREELPQSYGIWRASTSHISASP